MYVCVYVCNASTPLLHAGTDVLHGYVHTYSVCMCACVFVTVF